MNIDKPEKTLKQEGVPLGARLVFRVQHVGFLLMAVLLVLTIPFAAMWAMLHHSGEAFIEGANEALAERLERVKAHRAKVVRLYGRQSA